ncbi:MAG: DAK2 domain-containing protein [Clostridia bacterium]|nr:DAK2 domain-containing protein [Clostridia bacterium]
MSKKTDNNKQDAIQQNKSDNKKPAEKKAKSKKLEKKIIDIVKVDKEKAEKKKAEKEKVKKEKAEKKVEKMPEKAVKKPVKAEKKPATKDKKPKTEKPENKPAKAEEKVEKKTAKKAESKPATEKKPTKKVEKKPAKKADKKPATEKKTNEKWSIKQLGGYLFAKMMRGGASELRANAEEVNKLNVFPVPDGDTGDNMRMTIESGVASLENIDTDDLAEVLKVASRGMLLGARGNSGVILSQFFAGMAKGLENVETADAKKLAHALELGVQQAYGSVMTPTEGTILTVAREAVEYAVRRLNSKSTVQTLFADLVNEMNASLMRTPEILPVLGEAGVVDSGGAGLLYIIDGLNRVLNGEDVEDSEEAILPAPKPVPVSEGSFGPDSTMEYGYCTELLVQLMNRKMKEYPFDLDALKLYLANYGDSIVVFQTESIVKIHVHTLRPDKIMRYMLKRGDFISVKVENMSLQHTELEAAENPTEEKPKKEKPRKKYGIVAVSNGAGISDLFRQLGTDQIVEGGQTNNPSTNDFIDAFEKINAENIFVFPNNGNIIMAAGQAAEIYEKAKVYVVPSKSIGAGYVAMSSMSFDFSEPDALMAEAEDAISRVTSAYVSPAVRDADMNGVHVTDGDTMGIIAKEIVISGPDKMVSTYGLIDILLKDHNKFMITIFHGKDATTEERDMLAEYMLKTYPEVEAYYVDGGQEIYPFLFVAE